jgi:putative SOS response-associated peptidase YedK
MCGRFAFWNDKNKVLAHYALEDAPDFKTSYNITPSNEIPAIRQGQNRELANLHWGLVPYWARDTKLKPINARADSIFKKPFFRDSIKKRRCLIPANGYYEWKKVNNHKQPYFIKLKDQELFSFAGIWDAWDNPNGTLQSCAIITTESTPATADIHGRMPVIISPDDYDAWLTDGGDRFLKPYAGEIEAWPVSTQVNNPRHQGENLVHPVPVQ